MFGIGQGSTFTRSSANNDSICFVCYLILYNFSECVKVNLVILEGSDYSDTRTCKKSFFHCLSDSFLYMTVYAAPCGIRYCCKKI